jgi:hypothetical protein
MRVVLIAQKPFKTVTFCEANDVRHQLNEMDKQVSNFCTQCGKPNEASSKFCFNCGAPLVNPLATESPQKTSPHIFTPPTQIAERTQANSETTKITAEVLKLTGVGGWLRFLVIVLMVLGPLFALGTLGNLQIEFKALESRLPAFGQLLDIALAFTFLQVLWSIVVGYRLAKKYHDAPSLAKWFFILTPVLFIVQSLLMLSVTGLPRESANAMKGTLVLEFFKTVMSSLIWYLYLVRSKRVRYTYPDPITHVHCPDCRQLVYSQSAACPHCRAKLIPQ